MELVRTPTGQHRLSVERHDLRHGWYIQNGGSHRSWVITLAPEIQEWLNDHAPDTIVREDFMHDDYMCFFHFVFTTDIAAEIFAGYLKDNWAKETRSR